MQDPEQEAPQQESQPLQEELSEDSQPVQGEDGVTADFDTPSVMERAPSPVPEPVDPRLQFKDIYLSPTLRIPEDIEVTKAKSFLTTKSMYADLAANILSILSQRPNTMPHAPLQKYKIPSQSLFNDVEVNAAVALYKTQEIEGDLPDIMSVSKLWEWGGVSFGDAYTLMLSLRQLISSESLGSVRMWGKIHGTTSDYFIIEADGENSPEEIPEKTLDEDEEDEAAVEDENTAKPAKKITPVYPTEIGGANKYVYFVSANVAGPYVKLPAVTPEKLVIARNIKTYFTGKLDRQIKSYPPFNGTEAQYLRCQIARISAATIVCPVNYYVVEEEEKEMKSNPDYEKNLENELFLSPDQWVHHTPYILPQGRCEWVNPFPKVEGKEEEEDATEVEPESGPEVLRSVSADEDYGKLPAWRTTLCSKFLTVKYSPVMIQSTRWPGARSIYYNNQFTNIYVGYGLKETDESKPLYPQLPDMMKEFTVEEGVELMAERSDPSVEEEHTFEEELQEKVELAEDEAE